MNPIFQQQTLNRTGQFNELFRQFNAFSNPYQAFMNIAGQNPNMRQIISQIQQGANPQQVFTNLCNQRGINPQEFISRLTGNNTKF